MCATLSTLAFKEIFHLIFTCFVLKMVINEWRVHSDNLISMSSHSRIKPCLQSTWIVTVEKNVSNHIFNLIFWGHVINLRIPLKFMKETWRNTPTFSFQQLKGKWFELQELNIITETIFNMFKIEVLKERVSQSHNVTTEYSSVASAKDIFLHMKILKWSQSSLLTVKISCKPYGISYFTKCVVLYKDAS